MKGAGGVGTRETLWRTHGDRPDVGDEFLLLLHLPPNRRESERLSRLGVRQGGRPDGETEAEGTGGAHHVQDGVEEDLQGHERGLLVVLDGPGHVEQLVGPGQLQVVQDLLVAAVVLRSNAVCSGDTRTYSLRRSPPLEERDLSKGH